MICSYLKELLAKEGYLIVSVPYNVTFDHEQAAKQVYERFNSCLDTIVSSGIPNSNLKPGDLADLPLFSVGHRCSTFLSFLKPYEFSVSRILTSVKFSTFYTVMVHCSKF